jgi:predicted DNA-binding transcriptional regulator AlpA
MSHTLKADLPESATAPGWPLLVTIPRVMRELSISRRGVYALFEAGKLRRVLIGARSVRVRSAEVLALIAGSDSKPLRIPRLRNQTDAAATAQ